MDWQRYRPLVMVQGLMLACCTTIGPTVEASPAPGKTQAAFAQDRRACMASTDASLQPVATRMNLSAGSAEEVAAGNARIQIMYSDRFGQCMSARGDAVLASASAPVESQDVGSPIEAAVTPASRSASDSTFLDAEQALAPVVARLRHDCEGENIIPRAQKVSLSGQGAARLVTLTEPHGGSCFGEPGENDYLVERHAGGWSLLLAAEPGSILVLRNSHLGHADVELHSLGLCVYRYRWNGSGYAIVGSHDCALPSPPTTGTLPGLIR